MKIDLNLHQQRKKLNNVYSSIIKRKDLPEHEFDHLMRLWIYENEKLEKKEQIFEMNFLNPNNNITTNYKNSCL